MRIIKALSDRTIEVLELGTRGWYRDHAARSLVCGCSLLEPDADCPVGLALARLVKRQQEPVHHDVILREMLAPPHPRALR